MSPFVVGEKDQLAALLFGYEDKAVPYGRVAGEGRAAIIQGSAARQVQSDQVEWGGEVWIHIGVCVGSQLLSLTHVFKGSLYVLRK